jgi:hypothetical protein
VSEADPIVATDDAAQQQNGASGQEVAEVARPQPGEAGEQQEGEQRTEGEQQQLTPEQKRILKLERSVNRSTAQKYQAIAERDQAFQRLQELEARFGSQGGEQGQNDEPKAVDPRELDRLADERARHILRDRELIQKRDATLAAGRKIPGFDEAVATVGEEVPLLDRQARATPFLEAVLELDKPAQTLHWLGNNPEEAAAFARLTPLQIGIRLARLESRIEREAKNTSAAPTPLRPVSSRTAPGNTPSDSDNIKDWMAKENARLAAKRKARYG